MFIAVVHGVWLAVILCIFDREQGGGGNHFSQVNIRKICSTIPGIFSRGGLSSLQAARISNITPLMVWNIITGEKIL